MKSEAKLRLLRNKKTIEIAREEISKTNLPLEGRVSHMLTGCCIKLNSVISTLENVLKSL